MICTADELMLVLQNWLTDSAKVVFTLNVLGAGANAPALGAREEGRIIGLDPRLPGFSFSSCGENLIIVNLREWSQIGYADNTAYPPGQNIKEAFSICRPGASISMWTE